MTRSAPLKQAGAAKKRSQAAATALTELASMTFLIDEDNGGRYHWAIMADGGETLVRSAGFGSYQQAKQAAGVVHRGASRATFEDRSGEPPPGALPARRDAVAGRDCSDAERWLDEGGSFSKAVSR